MIGHDFYPWQKRYSKEDLKISKDSFIKIDENNNSAEQTLSGIKINYKEFSIQITKDFDEETFQKVIRSFTC